MIEAKWRIFSPTLPPLVTFPGLRGGSVGLGVLLEPTLVLTCAHVVAYALGLRPDHSEMPAEPVRIRPIAGSAEIEADLILWQPLLEESGDFALLRLREAAPEGPAAAVKTDREDLLGMQVHAYGFAKEGGGKLRWAKGTLSMPLSGGWVQINDETSSGYPIQPGYSGTGLFTDQGEVVGIVVAADSDIRLRVSAAIPLYLIWPNVAQHLTSGPAAQNQMPESMEERYRILRQMEAERAKIKTRIKGLGDFASASDRKRLENLTSQISALKSALGEGP